MERSLELVKNDAQILQLVNKAKEIETATNELQIAGDDDLITANNYLGGIKKIKKAADDKRKSFIKPLQDVVAQVNGYFQSFLKPLDNADATLRKKVLAYHQEQERKRKEEEERLRKLAEKEQKRLERLAAKRGEPTPPPIVVPMTDAPIKTVSSESASTGFRNVWDFEIVDAAKVPREFLIVNEKAIRAAVKAGVREIPGVRIFQTKQVAVTAK